KLQTLKSKLAPTDLIRSLELEYEYKKLKDSLTLKQNIKAWLDKYMQMYHKAKVVGIVEVKDTQRCYRDFIIAINKIAPVLAQRYEEVIDEFAPEGHEALLFKVIKKFYHHIRLRDIKNVKSVGIHAAFPVGAELNNKKLSFRNK
ncbi:MAG: hypothetical protein Q9221_008549, partial [Calogaya cf. arnoldii]